VTGGRDAANSSGYSGSPIQRHAESAHTDVARPRPVGDLECPGSDRVLPPEVDRHERPVIVALFIDEIVVSVWQQDRLGSLR
jgi:hypothetical protein